MSKRVIIDGNGNGNGNEMINNVGEKVMERSEVIEMVKGFVSEMNKDERKDFIKELSRELKISFGEEGRKGEVKRLLEESGDKGISIMEMSEILGLSNKNISSLLSYLRKDGMKLMTKSDGRKVIER